MATTVHGYRKKPLPSGYVWIGRRNKYSTGTFGNPHPLGRLGSCPECYRKFHLEIFHEPNEVISLYEVYFFQRIIDDENFRAGLITLRGKPLVCCGARECHGHVIASFIDSLPLPASEEEVIAAARTELARLAAEAVEAADGL